MEDELDCDFYFGNIDDGHLKKIDFALFRKKISQLQTQNVIKFNWIKGSVGLVLHPYHVYVLTGDILCLSNWLVLIFARFGGKKTFLWTHGWYGDEKIGKRILKKIFLGLSSGVFLYGDYAKNLMVNTGIAEKKLHPIYNSLDYDKQLFVRNNLKKTNIYSEYFKNTYPVLIFSGRLTKVKKIELLIEVQTILLRENFILNVVLIGDGGELHFLKEKISNFHTEQYFWFYGACYDEDIIGNFYYNADICISPGNVGLTAIHSMMYGCPVITHADFTQQMPEFEVIEKGMTGDFFEYNDVESLANTIKNWIRRFPQKSEDVMNECYRKIDEKYNPHYQIKIFKDILYSGCVCYGKET
jgi:glycosyltransferase involved in cell wall biosynthesis